MCGVNTYDKLRHDVTLFVPRPDAGLRAIHIRVIPRVVCRQPPFRIPDAEVVAMFVEPAMEGIQIFSGRRNQNCSVPKFFKLYNDESVLYNEQVTCHLT